MLNSQTVYLLFYYDCSFNAIRSTDYSLRAVGYDCSFNAIRSTDYSLRAVGLLNVDLLCLKTLP